jgi:hypothetical protein
VQNHARLKRIVRPHSERTVRAAPTPLWLKAIAWVTWLAVVGASVAAGLLLLAFGLQAPDHPVATPVAHLRITVTATGLGIPFLISLFCMAKSQLAIGLSLAILMFPIMLVVAYVFGA